ncbi:MAG: efflux RND transporter periplasmic adaptor subunit [Nitrospirota bacterium]|nr:efflux RND transporter periplasmic adaptor subunit [Nitrospirota bacterium]MDP2381260.1 efflux RND transporter periplasmic adaptor subunit [Nitrospirota bacterium]MDP3597184.1 efflux RND transporter periplasmic adaptor subunit [Nitrospirota bacterium]
MRIRWTTLTGTSVFALCLFVTACGDRGNEEPAQPPKASTQSRVPRTSTIQAPASVRNRLRTDRVAAHVVPEVVTAPGEVALDLKQVAKIASRIEGQVQSIHVQLGDRVRRDQPLLAIESLRLDELVQEYLVTKAQADVAESGYRRTNKLWAERIVTERRLVEERGRNLEAQARHQHVREKLLNMGMTTGELRELEHGSHQEGHRYTLTSPIAGTVVAQNVVRGQGVAPGNELFEVVDTSRVWVFASLPIEQARKFKEGDVGTILPKGGEPVTAPLTYLAPIADETTRTIRVRFEVTNEQQRLKPREYVDVQLAVASPPTLAVPVSALTMVDNVRGVFVQRENGYTFVPIEGGREGGGWVEVKKGLSEGEVVVIDGVFDLKNVLLKEHIESGEEG